MIGARFSRLAGTYVSIYGESTHTPGSLSSHSVMFFQRMECLVRDLLCAESLLRIEYLIFQEDVIMAIIVEPDL